MPTASTAPKKAPQSGATMLRMAEPDHRVAPRGNSTGESVRHYPKSAIRQVREVCLFYVKKCSGKYDDNKTAARYVHQMAEEVLGLLAGVAGELKKSKNEPEIFQALLDEWHSSFPSSLGNLGTPKAIAALIAKQADELNELRAALEEQKTARETDVTEILRSMDIQLQAYRNSVTLERKQQKLLDEERMENYEKAIAEYKAKTKVDMAGLISKHKTELNNTSGDLQSVIEDLQQRNSDLEMMYNRDTSAWRSKVQEMTETHDAKVLRLRSKIKEAHDKYYALSHSVNDDFSIMSTASDDEGNDNGTDDGTRITEVSQTVKAERKKARRKAKILRQLAEKEMEEANHNGKGGNNNNKNYNNNNSGGDVNDGMTVATGDGSTSAANRAKQAPRLMTAAAVQKLNDQIKELTDSNIQSQLAIDSMKTEKNQLQTEKMVLLRRMQDMEKHTETIRRALCVSVNDDGDNQTAAQCYLFSAHDQQLAHTPHLLDCSRHQGSAGYPILTAYTGPGVY